MEANKVEDMPQTRPMFERFVVEQTSGLVRASMTFNAVSMLFSFVKALAHSSHGQSGVELCFSALPAAVYGIAAYALRVKPDRQETLCFMCLVFRALYGLGLSSGLVPITPWTRLICMLHLDKSAEIAIMGLLEPVRISWMAPSRMVLAIGYSRMYEIMGMPYPWLQGICVHSCGLLVGVLVNLWYRRLFSAHQGRLLHQLSAGTLPSEKAAPATGMDRGLGGTASAGVPDGPRPPMWAEGVRVLERHKGMLKVQAFGPRCYKSRVQGRHRVSVTLHGGVKAEELPADLTEDLKRRMEERLPGIRVSAVAIRPGCVVVCFDVCNVDHEDRQDTALLCALTAKATEEWSRECGLEAMGAGAISVQACLSNRLQSGSEYSIALPSSVLLLPPLERHTQTQQQQQQLCRPCRVLPAAATFEVSLSVDVMVPTQLGVLRGWRGIADSPEELENMEASVCLLAAVQGRFHPLRVQHVEGKRAQVTLSLPTDIFSTPTSTNCSSVVFELWAAGKLACSANALLLPAEHGTIAAELQAWNMAAPAPEAAAFVDDLVEWVHLQSACSQGHPTTVTPEVLLQLADVGRGLLLHSLCSEMVGVAGLLLKWLSSPPFNLAFQTLASEALALEDHQGGAKGAHAAAQLVAAADASGSATLQAQCAQWQNSHSSSSSSSSSRASALALTSPRAVSLSSWLWLCACELAPSRSRQHKPAVCTSGSASHDSCSSSNIVRATDHDKHCSSSSSSSSNAYSGVPGPVGTTRSRAPDLSSAANERGYRSWVNVQHATATKAAFLFALVCLGVLLLRSARVADIYLDSPAMLLLLAFYTVVNLSAYFYLHKSEALVVFVYMGRFITLLALGWGLLPMCSSFSVVYRFRIEVLLEVCISSSMEIVRIPWLVPMRAMLTLGHAAFYQASGFACPWLQALAVNVVGIMVGLLMDKWHRLIFSQHRARNSAEATPCEGGQKHRRIEPNAGNGTKAGSQLSPAGAAKLEQMRPVIRDRDGFWSNNGSWSLGRGK